MSKTSIPFCAQALHIRREAGWRRSQATSMTSSAMRARLPASRSLMVFLVIATALLGGTRATTSSEATCLEEGAACVSDAECLGCLTDYDLDQYNECYQSAEAEFDGNTFSCELASAGACCFDVASVNDCMANDAFVELQLCTIFLVTTECTSLTCSIVGGVDADDATSGSDAEDATGGNEAEDATGGNGAARTYSFPLRAGLGFALGMFLLLAVSV